MLTDYTTYNDIRAVLGVSEDDLTDTTLALQIYEDYLTQELEDIDITLPDTYTTTAALATPTAAETRFVKACNLFATFSVAKTLTAALPLFAAKQITDGKAQVSRFDNPYKDAIKSINEQYETLKTRLIAALGAIGTTTTAATVQRYFAVISPSVDPVTGT